MNEIVTEFWQLVYNGPLGFENYGDCLLASVRRPTSSRLLTNHYSHVVDSFRGQLMSAERTK